MIATLTDYHDRRSWLAARQAGIGASEVSALFDLSPWQSIFSLWAEKTGLAAPVEVDEDYLVWGQLQEEPVAKFYEIRTGRRVWTGGSPYCIAQHPTLPMLRCTPDRLVEGAPDIGMDEPGGLQIKSAAWFKEPDWQDGIPAHVRIQVQAEMACTGAPWWSVPVYLGGKFRNFDVMRDDGLIAEIEAQVAWFWKFVETKTRPEIDGHVATGRMLRRLHPLDDGSTVELPPEAAEWFEQWSAAKQALSDVEKANKKAKEEAENRLRAAIGPSTFGVLPDGRRLSLKHVSRAGYVVEPTTYRTLKLETTTKGKGRR